MVLVIQQYMLVSCIDVDTLYDEIDKFIIIY
jgi:hypothetical protein